MELSKNIKDGFIELVFGPRWTYIAAVRSFLQSFLAIALTDCKKADVISMAASELLENAVKYASEEGTKVTVEHKPEENKLYLSVENFSNPSNCEVLRNEIERINSGDPEEVYLMKMAEAALRTDGGSQLGLARIRYESNAEIKFSSENNLLKVSVIFDLK